jgi:hypothetical protein
MCAVLKDKTLSYIRTAIVEVSGRHLVNAQETEESGNRV